MDKLPLEVIERIVAFLPDRPTGLFLFGPRPPNILPQLATVSASFRDVIERRTFRSLSISSDAADLCFFETALRRHQPRRAYLTQVSYRVVLPLYDKDAASRVESEADRQANDTAFTAAIQSLFGILHELDEGPCGPGGLTLSLGAVSSPSDTREARHPASKNRLGLYRFLRSRIRLQNHKSLPCVSCVSTLAVAPAGDRHLSPSTGVLLATRMPNLQALHITAYAGELRYPAIARNDRHELAAAINDALSDGSPPTITNTSIVLDQDGGPENQLLALPDLTFPGPSDPLGLALCTWSQHNLKTLRVEGVFDGSLFWSPTTNTRSSSSSSSSPASPPTWSALERLDVQLERNTPAGWWYFMPQDRPAYGTPARDPATDLHDAPPRGGGSAATFDRRAEEAWAMKPTRPPPQGATLTRNVPCEETMQQLFEAWARALGCMPVLRAAVVRFQVEIPVGEEGDVSLEPWEVMYQAPGEVHWKWRGGLVPAEKESRRLSFHNTRGWRPGEAVMRLLREVGKDVWPGTGMVEIEVDEWDQITRE